MFNFKFQIGTQFYWQLNQLMRKPIAKGPCAHQAQKAKPSKKSGQKRQLTIASLENAGEPDGKKRKENPNQANKSLTAQKEKKNQGRKGWKGYVEMSREDFERDLALKEQESNKVLLGKRTRKPKTDNMYTA